MKHGLVIQFLFCAVLGASLSARAEDLNFAVPQSNLPLEQNFQVERPHRSVDVEMGYSNWVPANLNSPSRLDQTSEFRTSLPDYFLNASLSPWALGNYVNMAPKFGVSFMQLRRSGSLNFTDSNVTTQDSVDMYSMLAALEFSPQQKFWHDTTTAYLDVGLLPTYLQSATSDFNDGYAEGEFATQVSAALAWNIAPLARFLNARSFSLEAGYQHVQSIGNISFSGSGFLLGARLGLD